MEENENDPGTGTSDEKSWMLCIAYADEYRQLPECRQLSDSGIPGDSRYHPAGNVEKLSRLLPVTDRI